MQFVNFNTDYRLLFAPLEEQTFTDAFGYYGTFFNAPIGVRVRAFRARVHAGPRADGRGRRCCTRSSGLGLSDNNK